MKLKGKTAIITGASGGIGTAIAKEFAKEGANLVLCYNKNAQKAEELSKNLKCNTIIVELELSNSQLITEVVRQTVENFNSIDILVNNGAILQQKQFEEISSQDWDNMLNVNLKGPFLLSQKVIPYMKKNKWGRIVNISSIGGQWGGNLAVHYSASKAGLISLTKSLSKIYSKEGILTNCIAPGLIDTEMIANEVKTKAGIEKIKNIPIGRIGTPEEVAKTALFLVSKDSSYITGQTINVNGGMLG